MYINSLARQDKTKYDLEEGRKMIVSEKKSKIDNAEKTASILQAILEMEDAFDQDKEHFWVIGINNRCVVQYIDLVSLGTTTSSLVHPREVFRLAILKNTTQVIIAHNHPGEDTEITQALVSKEDILITERLKKAGEIIGIKVIDHVVFNNLQPDVLPYSFQ